jgi:hypothetical protein
MPERLAQLEAEGYPAYTTSAGWFGFSDEKIRRLCREGLADGWTHFKLKVGGEPADDLRRARIMREEIGWDNKLMVDANQKWGVDEAIAAPAARPRRSLVDGRAHQPRRHPRPRAHPPRGRAHPHRHRRALPQPRSCSSSCCRPEAIDVCQIDSCRVAGVNENLAILLMAAKFGVPSARTPAASASASTCSSRPSITSSQIYAPVITAPATVTTNRVPRLSASQPANGATIAPAAPTIPNVPATPGPSP